MKLNYKITIILYKYIKKEYGKQELLTWNAYIQRFNNKSSKQ